MGPYHLCDPEGLWWQTGPSEGGQLASGVAEQLKRPQSVYSIVQELQTAALTPEMRTAVTLRLSKVLMLETVYEKVTQAAVLAASEAKLASKDLGTQDAFKSVMTSLQRTG